MLKSAFVWLDAHPTTYWVLAGSASIALALRLVTLLWAGSRPAGNPGPGRWIDPIILLLFVLAWRWPLLLWAQELNPDESQLIAGAITLAHDPVFWRAVDGTTSGPLNFYALLPIHWLGAPLDFFTVRFAALLMIWGSLWACLGLLRRHAGAIVAWLAILPAAALYATVTSADLTHYSSEHFPVFLLAVAAALLAGPEIPRGWRLMVGAALAGAAPWAKLQVGPMAAVLVLWAAGRLWSQSNAPGRPWAALARLFAAALAPTAVITLTAALAGVAGMAWERYFENNVLYVGQAQPLAVAFAGMRELAKIDGRMSLFVCTIIPLCLGAGLWLVVRRTRPPLFLLCTLLLALAAIFGVAAPRREFLHYALLLPIPFTLLFGSLLGPCWQGLASRWTRLAMAFIVTTTGLLVPLLTRAQRPVPYPFGQFARDWQFPRSAEAEVIRKLTPSGGSLAVWGWACNLHVETGLRQATRDPHIAWVALLPHPRLEAYRRQYLDDLARSAPAVFVDATGPGAFALTNRLYTGHEIVPELADYIRYHYTLAADLGRARVYVRNRPDGKPPVDSTQIKAWLARGRPAPPSVSTSVDTETMVANLDELARRDIEGRQVTMIHPPCRLEWTLPMDARAVELDFGFDPKAVANGSSNGAEIIIEMQEADTKRPLYRRFLDPVQRPADRGKINVRIPLPPFAPSTRLVLRSDPGPSGNNAWDWVYLGSFAFQREDAFSPEQFPGFNRVPDAASAPNSNFGAWGKERVFEADPPVTLMFRLRGEEKHLRLAFGMRSSAYTGSGRTDGVTFHVELRRPGGDVRPVWSRGLRPVTNEHDRGTQEATIPLGPLQRGDELILRIDFGPIGNGSWDSTYFRRVLIE